MSAAVLVAVLVTAGVYLILQRGLVRVTFGFALLAHAANVLILAAGGMARREVPFVGDGEGGALADPLLQAFALTAIVITFALTVFLLALAGHGGEEDGEAADAEPSDRTADDGTVVDEPEPGGPGAGTTTGRPVGTEPVGDQPTGRTRGKEHA